MNHYGVIFCFIFSLLVAVNTVFLGHVTATIPPASIALGGFIIATTFFFIITNFYKNKISYKARIQQAKVANIVMLNISTCFAWLGLFYAVAYIRPSIASMFLNGVTPIFSIIMVLIMKERQIAKYEWISAVGILCSLAYLSLVVFYLQQQQYEAKALLLGIFFACLAGFGQVIVIIYSKKILQNGVPPHEILQFRFFALMALCALLIKLQTGGYTGFLSHWQTYLLVGLIFIALPLYFLQWGIKTTDPVVVNIIVSCIPIIVMLLEVIATNKEFNGLLSIGIISGVSFLIYGVFHKTIANKAEG